MTDRGERGRIGDAGEAFVKAIIQTHGGWIARDQQIDVGIDLEAELDQPEALGHFIKVQVKSTTEAAPDDGVATLSLSKTFIRYAMECRLPVVVVRLWLPSQRASYVWMQEWIDANREMLSLDDAVPATVAVRIDQDLQAGLGGRLRLIARGDTPLQFRLALRDVARWAVLHRNPVVVKTLAELLVALGNERDAPVGAMIEELVSFSSAPGMLPGQMRAVWEYHPELLPMLIAVCRAFASQFGRAEVERMVIRGDSFSRSALYGLAVLYDTAPAHMQSLDLPAAFEKREQFWLAFYCRLRERYPGVSAIDLVMGKSPLRANGGGVRRSDDFLNAYANRGEPALYDYFEPSKALRARLAVARTRPT